VKILTVTLNNRRLSFLERNRKRFVEVGAKFPDFVWARPNVNGLPQTLYLSCRPVRAAWVHPVERHEVIVTPKPGQSLAEFVFAVIDEFFQPAAQEDSTS
jgi:hypothetical protein